MVVVGGGDANEQWRAMQHRAGAMILSHIETRPCARGIFAGQLACRTLQRYRERQTVKDVNR